MFLEKSSFFSLENFWLWLFFLCYLILDLSKTPVVKEKTILKETLEKMVYLKIGMACVVKKNNLLLGVITDGDLRRAMFNKNIENLTVKKIMNKKQY